MLFLLQTFSPLVAATVTLLQQLQVKRITPNTVNEVLQNHPDYPSLLSINDSLQQWNIDTAAFMAEPEKLNELPTPFIAVLNNKDFVTVIQNGETITYKNGTNKKAITKTKEEFIKEWKGIVLLAEKNEQSGDANYAKEKQKELLQAAKLLLVLLLLAGIGLFAMYKSNWHIGFSLLLLIKLAGIAVASLLLWYEIDKTNPLLKQIAVNANGLGITIGNLKAAHTIIKVCNPYCNPCAKAHPKIDALLETNPNIKVQIIFTATDKEEDKRALPVKHLLAVDAKGDKALTAKALNDWYMAEPKDYEIFAAKYPINGELKQQNEKVKAMSDWCNKTNIEFTPTFFINGYQLPDIYSVDDVNYFLTE